MTRDEYIQLRRKYEPDPVRLALIAEPPPLAISISTNLKEQQANRSFWRIMKQLPYSPATKLEGLTELKRRGWILVDATYEPVNELSNSSRDDIIKRDYPRLRNDLERLLSDRSTPLILIKANVCRILTPRLLKDGFNVLNTDTVPFSSTGHQTEFYNEFEAILKSNGLVV